MVQMFLFNVHELKSLKCKKDSFIENRAFLSEFNYSNADLPTLFYVIILYAACNYIICEKMDVESDKKQT